MPRQRHIVEPNLIAIAHLVLDLQRGVYSMKELAERCGLTYITVQKHCAAFHAVRAIHIARWERDGKNAETIRIYKMGDGVDAIAKTRDKQEKNRRLRESRRKLREEFQRTGKFDLSLARVVKELENK